MQAIIKNVSQAFSLETGVNTGVMDLQLPDGSRVKALISDEVMSQILKLYVNMGGPLVEASAPPSGYTATSALVPSVAAATSTLPDEDAPLASGYAPLHLSDEGDAEFGGDWSENDAAPGGALASVGQQLQEAEAHVANAVGGANTLTQRQLKATADRLSQPSLPAPRFTAVQADEKGNPVRQGDGIMDHHSIIGGTPTEEDEAGQL